MSNLLAEKLLKQKLKLQLQSLDSPSDFTSSTRNKMDAGVSPMTDLAINLGDTSLNSLTPVQDSKRRLSMGSDSSTPSPDDKGGSLTKGGQAEHLHTPLSSLTNKPRRNNQPSRLSFSLNPQDTTEANKENIPFPCGSASASSPHHFNGHSSSSPGKLRAKAGHSRKSVIKASSCTFATKVSPAKGLVPRKLSAPAMVSFSLNSPLSSNNSDVATKKSRLTSMKKPEFSILDDVEDANSRDSGYDSQNILEEFCSTKPKPNPGSLEDILAECSPGKDEDGVTPLKSSPDRGVAAAAHADVKVKTDGFDFSALDTIVEDNHEDSPRFDLTSLLSNKIMETDDCRISFSKNSTKAELVTEPGLLLDKTREGQPGGSGIMGAAAPGCKLFDRGQKRPKFRRTLSMFDRPMSCDSGSPVSRYNDPVDLNAAVSRFKRPEPPRPEFGDDLSAVTTKRQRMNDEAGVCGVASTSCGSTRPKFFRSFSENPVSVMESCELKENIDVLPDSSRLYSLPAIEDSKNPSLRSITCDTLAQLLTGQFDHLVNSFRIIDCRYAYEYADGHIKYAENWQHGEDEEFIKEFLPEAPLPAPPTYDPSSHKKRDILIFHCEFSSKRGPDFYKKLRERDRQLNQHVYPALHYPEIYLLHLGYKQFFSQYPSLCVGTYTTMDDPRHQESYRKMRAKSKSWSGGTIMRTGKLNRHLYM
eukprot:TRINITY_DN2159_c0_g1_i13.p1 TRINITY_DN2159_c0_g1~~TRINITY_DN2159_c0_g1_i13.p1  ORF type:complete len:699 (+),score=177.90 TRINITY_DN2159_c0_g1_i13:179-2275(+)